MSKSSTFRIGYFLTTTRDWIRYNVPLRALLSWGGTICALFTFRLETRLNRLAESHRIALGIGVPSLAGKFLRSWVADPVKSKIWRERRIGWGRYRISGEGGTLHKSLIARAPDEDGKGVLSISFEYDLLTLLSVRDLEKLLDSYIVVYAGSWSPPSYQALWSFPYAYRHEFFAGLSHPEDVMRIRSLGFEVPILPLYMSSWLVPEDFHPRSPQDRDVDIVMVANWAHFKRHWVLFDALKRMNRPDLNIVLIGQPDSQRTVENVRKEAELYGVAGQIQFLNRLPVDEVWRWLARSRISLVFSKREGSCVVVGESMMSDTPVGLLKGAGIGSIEFINPKTGMLLREGKHLADDLSALLEKSKTMNPRAWAVENISSQRAREITTEKIKSVMNDQFRGDLLDVCIRGVLCYRTPPVPEIELAYRHLSEQHGLNFNLVSNLEK